MTPIGLNWCGAIHDTDDTSLCYLHPHSAGFEENAMARGCLKESDHRDLHVNGRGEYWHDNLPNRKFPKNSG
jgi:hypothetical protein